MTITTKKIVFHTAKFKKAGLIKKMYKQAAAKDTMLNELLVRKKSQSDLILKKIYILAARLQVKQAQKIRVFDLRGLSLMNEAILVVTAKNLRQAKSLADDVLECCDKNDFSYLGMEGYKNSGWILLDLNDVVVHIFQEETRHYYNLEGLWPEAYEIPINVSAHDEE